MLIDWFTVLAQIINFLILVFLLKKFLYGPILKAMEKREEKISAAMDKARESQAEAGRKAMELEQEKKALQDAKERTMNRVKQEIKEWKENTIKETRGEIETLRNAWMDRLSHERQTFLHRLKAQVTSHVISISEKILQDLADDDLERQVIKVFMEKMERDKDLFHLEPAPIPLNIQSGFEIDKETADKLRRAILRYVPEGHPVRFEVDKNLGLGIQVMAGGTRIAWDLSRYLEGLEKEIMTGLFPARQEKK